jgi:hypothetical protein
MSSCGFSLAVLLALWTVPVSGQAPEAIDLDGVTAQRGWHLAGRSASMVDVQGKRALRLSEGPGMGIAWLKDVAFTNGTIEVDLLGRSAPVQGSFLGIAFRVVDDSTHDVVYFRPFNFAAATPVQRSHGVQYVSHPAFPWNRLRAEHPGAYEAALDPAPDGDRWFRARIVIDRPRVRVYVDGAPEPVLAVDELSDRPAGSIGLWVGEGSGGHFANLRVTRVP